MTETSTERESAPLLPPLLAMLLAVIGTSTMLWTFVEIIDLALGGGGTLGLSILFFLGAGIDLVALVIAVIGIVRGRRRGLSFIALGFALVPVALVALTAVAANATV
ncbi:MAG: hypothetical protein CMF56_03925 [Leifsonia sp.]|nr:hypothetical protein [Leifsonia sp.]|tara:strand:- start:62784 stop:63104 length:321 start_codon:yes stop_codon:yes gene_type:complete